MKVGVTLAIAMIILALSSAILGYSLASSQLHSSIGEIEGKISSLTYIAEVISAKEHVEDSFYYAQAIIEDECIAESIGKVLNMNFTVKSNIKASANTLFLKKLKHDLTLLNETLPPEHNIGLHEQYVGVLESYIRNYEKYIIYFENGKSCSMLKTVLASLNSDYSKLSVLANAIVKNISK